jgi:hypothetical protein
MRSREILSEESVRDQIRRDVARQGDVDDLFVRFTDVDRIGPSMRQEFGRTPDLDDPDFDWDYIGPGRGRRALWFYPARYYLRDNPPYAADRPYAWLVRLRPDAWLQPVGRTTRGIEPAPPGRRRVGFIKQGHWTPAAIFFEPAFDVVGRYYDYAGQHRRHGQVRGAPPPTFFDRVRGDR